MPQRSLIEQLFYGHIEFGNPACNLPAYKEASQKLDAIEQQLKAQLDENGRKLLLQYNDAENDLNTIIQTEAMRSAFSLAALLCAEAYAIGQAFELH